MVELLWFGAVGIPICAIAHFVTLLAIRRRIEKERLFLQSVRPDPPNRNDHRLPFGANQDNR